MNTTKRTDKSSATLVPTRPEWLPRDLYPFEDRYIDLDGCRVHYVDEGEGPVLLLLHGNPTYSFLYRNIIKGLRGRFRCIALDYPGFGLSTPRKGYSFRPEEHSKIVERFILGLNLSGITLMVHDWGGPIGLGAAARHPDRFSGLVIGNTRAWPFNGVLRFELLSRLLGSPPGRFLIMNYNIFVNVGIPLATFRSKPSVPAMRAYRGPFARRSSRVPIYIFVRSLLRSRDYLASVRAGLSSLRHLHALILWGDRDPSFMAGERRHFEHLFPDHRTVILHGAGHFIQEDAPGEIVTAIRSLSQR